MALIVRHDSAAVVFGKGDLTGDICIWENAACRGLEFSDRLHSLSSRPGWESAPENARLGSEKAVLHRLSLPPAVHFDRGAELTVTSVYAATVHGQNTQRGSWVSPSTFLEAADEAWQVAVLSLAGQLRFALAAGYLSLPNVRVRAPSSSLAQQPSAAAALLSLATGPAHAQPEQTQQEEVESFSHGPIITCSGYGEQDEARPGTGTVEPSRATEEEEEGAPHGPAAAHAPARWTPGQVAQIAEGGSDVQSILDSDGVRLGVVCWHATWIEACLETAPFMHRLAARFPGVAVMHLDVEASMASKLFAYEKVMTRSESRRRGAKPVLRDGASFPCLTVHDPCNLVPSYTFCGKAAIDELAQLLSPRAAELVKRPAGLAQEARPAHAPEAEARPRPAAGVIAPTMPSSDVADSMRRLDLEEEVVDGSPGRTSHKQLIRGALEFKQILSKAKSEGRGVLVLWTSGSAGKVQPSLPQETAGDIVFVEADVTAGRDNRQLAGPLGVRAFPTAQAYFNMKLMKGVDSRSPSWKGAEHAVSALAEILRSTIQGAPSPTAPSGDAGPGSSTQREASSAPRAGSPAVAAAAAAARDDSFDPPPAGAKAGAKRRIGRAVAVYWPKMPCLECGCPWWLGEDWDARCARCGWSAERDGYDDDSQPLPAYKAKYSEFTKILSEGRTAEYAPVQAA